MTETAASGVKRTSRSGLALTLMARLGYGARGFIYLLIGGNALAATAGGQKPHGFTDGLQAIGSAPLRTAVGLVLLAGLGCFVGYFLIHGFRELVRQRGKRHRFAAAGLIGDATIYIVFVAALAGAAFGSHGDGEGQTQSWFAWAMHLPFGRVLLGLVGVVMCGCGLAYLALGPFGRPRTRPQPAAQREAPLPAGRPLWHRRPRRGNRIRRRLLAHGRN